MKSKLKKVVLLILVVALATLATEVILRLTGRFSSEELHSVTTANYNKIPGMWEPHQDFVSREIPALAHHVVTNSLGLRGAETTLEPRMPRLLCIGDSFTYGDFVDNQDTMPAQIQKCLGPEIEVLNGGVKGTTVVDQRKFLDRQLVLKPDAVLLTYCENDLTDLDADPPMHVLLERNRKLKSGFLNPIYNLVRDTCLFNLLLKARSKLRALRTEAKDERRQPRNPLAQLGRYVSEVVKLRKELEERGIALFVAAYPSHLVLSEKRERTIDPLLEALGEVGIEGIDPTPALRDTGLPNTELYLLPHDGHPGPRGYEIAAKVVAEKLRPFFEKRRSRSSFGQTSRSSDATTGQSPSATDRTP